MTSIECKCQCGSNKHTPTTAKHDVNLFTAHRNVNNTIHVTITTVSKTVDTYIFSFFLHFSGQQMKENEKCIHNDYYQDVRSIQINAFYTYTRRGYRTFDAADVHYIWKLVCEAQCYYIESNRVDIVRAWLWVCSCVRACMTFIWFVRWFCGVQKSWKLFLEL